MPQLPLASLVPQAGTIGAILAVGFLIGIYGHIIKSRTVILVGIAIVGTMSALIVAGWGVNATG